MKENQVPTDRSHYLDGLRGVAAFLVMIEHLSALFPVGERHVGSGFLGDLLSSCANFPVRAGTFSVYIFFAISGIVIAASATRPKPWPASLIRRFARLTLPMVAATLWAWSLLNFLPNEMPAMRLLLDNHWTRTMYQHGAPSLGAALAEGIFGAYLTGKPVIVPVLWSMRIELYGSLAIYTFYRFVPERFRVAGLVLIGSALLPLDLWRYLAFPAGCLMFEVKRTIRIWFPGWLGVLVILAGIGIAILPTTPEARYASQVISERAQFEFDLPGLLNVAGAIILVFGVSSTVIIQRVLVIRAPLFLGSISYSLYLSHMPLFYTLGAAFLLCFDFLASPILMWSAAILLVFVAIVNADFMRRFIDEPATKLSQRLMR